LKNPISGLLTQFLTSFADFQAKSNNEQQNVFNNDGDVNSDNDWPAWSHIGTKRQFNVDGRLFKNHNKTHHLYDLIWLMEHLDRSLENTTIPLQYSLLIPNEEYSGKKALHLNDGRGPYGLKNHLVTRITKQIRKVYGVNIVQNEKWKKIGIQIGQQILQKIPKRDRVYFKLNKRTKNNNLFQPSEPKYIRIPISVNLSYNLSYIDRLKTTILSIRSLFHSLLSQNPSLTPIHLFPTQYNKSQIPSYCDPYKDYGYSSIEFIASVRAAWIRYQAVQYSFILQGFDDLELSPANIQHYTSSVTQQMKRIEARNVLNNTTKGIIQESNPNNDQNDFDSPRKIQPHMTPIWLQFFQTVIMTSSRWISHKSCPDLKQLILSPELVTTISPSQTDFLALPQLFFIPRLTPYQIAAFQMIRTLYGGDLVSICTTGDNEMLLQQLKYQHLLSSYNEWAKGVKNCSYDWLLSTQTLNPKVNLKAVLFVSGKVFELQNRQLNREQDKLGHRIDGNDGNDGNESRILVGVQHLPNNDPNNIQNSLQNYQNPQNVLQSPNNNDVMAANIPPIPTIKTNPQSSTPLSINRQFAALTLVNGNRPNSSSSKNLPFPNQTDFESNILNHAINSTLYQHNNQLLRNNIQAQNFYNSAAVDSIESQLHDPHVGNNKYSTASVHSFGGNSTRSQNDLNDQNHRDIVPDNGSNPPQSYNKVNSLPNAHLSGENWSNQLDETGSNHASMYSRYHNRNIDTNFGGNNPIFYPKKLPNNPNNPQNGRNFVLNNFNSDGDGDIVEIDLSRRLLKKPRGLNSPGMRAKPVQHSSQANTQIGNQNMSDYDDNVPRIDNKIPNDRNNNNQNYDVQNQNLFLDSSPFVSSSNPRLFHNYNHETLQKDFNLFMLENNEQIKQKDSEKDLSNNGDSSNMPSQPQHISIDTNVLQYHNVTQLLRNSNDKYTHQRMDETQSSGSSHNMNVSSHSFHCKNPIFGPRHELISNINPHNIPQELSPPINDRSGLVFSCGLHCSHLDNDLYCSTNGKKVGEIVSSVFEPRRAQFGSDHIDGVNIVNNDSTDPLAKNYDCEQCGETRMGDVIEVPVQDDSNDEKIVNKKDQIDLLFQEFDPRSPLHDKLIDPSKPNNANKSPPHHLKLSKPSIVIKVPTIILNTPLPVPPLSLPPIPASLQDKRYNELLNSNTHHRQSITTIPSVIKFNNNTNSDNHDVGGGNRDGNQVHCESGNNDTASVYRPQTASVRHSPSMSYEQVAMSTNSKRMIGEEYAGSVHGSVNSKNKQYKKTSQVKFLKTLKKDERSRNGGNAINNNGEEKDEKSHPYGIREFLNYEQQLMALVRETALFDYKLLIHNIPFEDIYK
jgi:hypothetical protein